MTNNTNKKINAKAVVGIGAGVVALTAAAYILFGPNGKKNRQAIKSWIIKMKGEIIEKIEQAKELTEPAYNKIIDKVKAKYEKLKDVDPEELASIISDIRKHWKSIEKEAGENGNKK